MVLEGGLVVRFRQRLGDDRKDEVTPASKQLADVLLFLFLDH